MEPNQINQTPNSNPMPAANPASAMPVTPVAPIANQAMPSHAGKAWTKWLWMAIIIFVLLIGIALAYAKWGTVDSSGMMTYPGGYESNATTSDTSDQLNDEALNSEIDASVNSSSETDLVDVDTEFN